MKTQRRIRGWSSAALAMALLAPVLAPGPAAAGPFDFIKKADERKSGAQPSQDQGRQQSQPLHPAVREAPSPSRSPQFNSSGSSPFDFIRKADERRYSSPPTPPQPTVPRVQPLPGQERSPGGQPNPFSFGRPPIEVSPRAPLSPGTAAPNVTPGPPLRGGAPTFSSPFGGFRRSSPPPVLTPPSHTETLPQPGAFPGAGGSYGPVPSPGVSQPQFGSAGGPVERGKVVTPSPRGGRGTLDSYFSRDARPHRERNRRSYPGPYYGGGYYPGPYYGGGYYPPDYYYSPYDVYPPIIYQPSPPVIVTPPEVIIVPAPETDGGYRDRREDREAEVAALDDMIQDIEEAWESGKLPLLMRHVRPDGDVQVYRDGEWVYSLSRSDFAQKTEQAFREYRTISMNFDRPERLSDDEARARAAHVYRTRAGEEHRVHVTYAFRRYGRAWRIIGLDYEPEIRDAAAGPPLRGGAPPEPRPRVEIESTPAAPAPVPAVASPAPAALVPHTLTRTPPVSPGTLRLVSAPPVRLRDLLNAPRPRSLATLKRLRGTQRTLYSLKAMRGVAPATLAWALYHQGDARPVETGIADVAALPANGWVAVRTLTPQLVTLAARLGHAAPPHAKQPAPVVRLAARTFPDAPLALVSSPPAGKAKHRAATTHKAVTRAKARINRA